MKIIFLDIDGVLNHTNWYNSDRNPGNINGNEGDIDPLCSEKIMEICEKTGAKIVLSSDWRISWPYVIDRLNKSGIKFGTVIDKTPEHMWIPFADKSRGSEIQDWLDNNECERYVIIDDRTDFSEEQKCNFVQIDSEIGITDEDVNLAIQILNR